jgi:hypothetical protein
MQNFGASKGEMIRSDARAKLTCEAVERRRKDAISRSAGIKIRVSTIVLLHGVKSRGRRAADV